MLAYSQCYGDAKGHLTRLKRIIEAREKPVIINYSGEGSRSNPEIILGDDANLMLTYHDMHQRDSKPTRRFKKIVKARKDGGKHTVSEEWRDRKIETDDLEVGRVACHFFDSGSFTLWTKAGEWAAKKGKSDPYAFYHTKKFWRYMDEYAAFVKEYKAGIDFYANVDVIPNPELSWRNQKYLEKEHGLKPIPVIHFTTKNTSQWLRKYMDAGYEMIALGGLVGSTSQDSCRRWLDDCFNFICDTGNKTPRVKVHGFGLTSYELMRRFPWYSVDSTSWTKVGAYGGIYIPHVRTVRGHKKFTFDKQPYLLKVSHDGPSRKQDYNHVMNIPAEERKVIESWLEHIGIPLGKLDKDGDIMEYGVVTRHTERRAANLHFFEHMRKSLPEYPWAFHSEQRPGFDIFKF